MKSMPVLPHAVTSEAEIGRDAFEISVSPRQNFSKPPPVPDRPTVTRKPRLIFWNSSANASVTGKTVLDPSAVITWAAGVSDVEESPPPQAVSDERSAAAAARRRRRNE